jgi:serine/threonine-protein kinase HipA
LGAAGWTLAPAYDINPTPEDKKPRILTTHINDDDGTCSIELVRSVIEAFSLKLKRGDQIIREVAEATRAWKDVAKTYGAPESEIRRMDSAFEHDDLQKALAM